MDITNLEVIKALVKLSGKPAKDIAATCAVSESNFSAYLRGVRPFPASKKPLLLLALGVSENGLLNHKPIIWHAGQNLDELEIAVKAFFKEGADIEGVWREGSSTWDVRRVFDNVLFAASDRSSRVIIKRSGIGFLMALNPPPISPDTIPGFRWQAVNPSAETMISIHNHRYDAWEKGEISNEEFDNAFYKKNNGVTWQDVRDFAEGSGITADYVLALLKSKQINGIF